MKTIEIVEVPSELGAGTRGASLGIEALKVSARNRHSDLFSRYITHYIEHHNQNLDKPPLNPNAKYIEGILEVGENVCEVVKSSQKRNVFPIILSGDHSMSFSTISGIKAAFPEKKLGVVWIDAHADLHSPFTSPSGNMHGMPLAMVVSEDNIDCKLNQPIPDTLSKWDRIKNMGVPGKKIEYEDLVFIGLRSTEKPENHLIKKHSLMNISVEELRSEGLEMAISKTKNHLYRCDIVYVSFDVDSMDPTLSMGTGTPVPNGITLEEAMVLNEAFITWEKTVAWEMVEINPTLDEKNKMAELAFDILENNLRALEKR
jgi:arginase